MAITIESEGMTSVTTLVYGYTAVVFALHVALYRPWALPMPFKAVLPIVHAALFTSAAWAITPTTDNPSAPSATLLIGMYFLNLAVGPVHTLLYFRTSHYWPALKVMLANVAVCSAFAGILLRVSSIAQTAPVLASLAWMAFVCYANWKKAVATDAKAAKASKAT